MQRRNPALIAGLLGSSWCLAPTCAHALSIGRVIDDAFSTPSLAFCAGLAGGALATGAVVGAVALMRTHVSRVAAADPAIASSETPDVAPAPDVTVPRHAATDYEDIAENYVRLIDLKERVERRAQGVAAILTERLGASMMEGLPVIERADGTVGDVGTSWWRRAVGEQAMVPSVPIVAEDDLAIPEDFAQSDLARLSDAAKRMRVGSIASRVAFVDGEAYPEHRSTDDFEVGDVWAAALAALDEKIAADDPMPVVEPESFLDAVGGAGTLDDPDGLEPSTGFIPFKTPGGHPEVVDTETYVDYLIRDEFSRNSSTAARRSSRRFLRMLEGGVRPPRVRHLADTPTNPAGTYIGRHFSTSEAAEA